jgi:hypothetical protein
MVQHSAEQVELEQLRRQDNFKKYLFSEEYQKKLIQRMQVNDACTNKPEARIMTWNLCARPENPVEGCIFFIENFGWTFDPRPHTPIPHLPFILFEYQKEGIKWLIEHIDGGRDGLVEKSRDMGISWIIFVWVSIWYWLFRDGVNILLGSYKEALVDNRSKDSLFGMIDYGVDSLPKWLMPKGYNKEKHRTQMKLVNPANQNLITGDTMNPDFGRGTRKTAILFDELGSWDYAKDAWESAGDSTSCRIANSTPKGYNYYKILRDSGIDVLTLHWKRHPLKDQQWYEFECARRTPEEVAQELDISYNKSQEGVVYPEWGDENVEKGTFEYDDGLPLYVGWDFGKSDDTGIIWVQPHHGKWRVIDTYRNNNKLIDFYIPFVTGVLPSDGYQYTKEDREIITAHKHWKRGTHFGDPAGRFTTQVSNQSVISKLQEAGINVNFRDEWKAFHVRKDAAKMMIMDGIELNSNPRTDYFSLCMSQAAYPSVKNTGMLEVKSFDPKHNWTSHYRSAFEYLALGIRDFVAPRRQVYDKFKPRQTVERVFGKRKLVGY